jgi:hypothetical protein
MVNDIDCFSDNRQGVGCGRHELIHATPDLEFAPCGFALPPLARNIACLNFVQTALLVQIKSAVCLFPLYFAESITLLVFVSLS